MRRHTFHFSNNQEMSYCADHLECFIDPETVDALEFDGDKPYEVTFTTEKKLPRTVIKKMLSHFQPVDYAVNGEE